MLLTAAGICALASAVCAENAPSTNSVTALGLSAYVINGQQNPTLTLQRGVTYVFQLNASFHPFDIKTNLTTTSLNRYDNGVTGQGTTVGNVVFAVPMDAPDQLFYHCENHAAMGGVLNIVSPPSPPTVKIVYISVTDTHVMMQSTGASNWMAMPEYSSNLSAHAWMPVQNFTNVFANGTNTTTFGRLDSSLGTNIFLRIRNQQQ